MTNFSYGNFSKPYPITVGTPPSNTLVVERWADLGNQTKARRYKVTHKNGRSYNITVRGKQRLVLDTVMHRPIVCGSRARLSQSVLGLREKLVHIHTEIYRPKREDSISEDYGVYYLDCKIERKGDEVTS